MNQLVKISKINATYIKVECSEVYIEQELSDHFSFQIPNAKYDPRVKKGIWDGYKRLYNRKYKRLYTGLLADVISFCKKHQYQYLIDKDVVNLSDISRSDVEIIINDVIKPQIKGKQITPHDYQIDAVYHMLRSNRSLCLSATSSGKSLVLYLVIRIYQLLDEFDNKHMLLIVPYASLVEQLYKDFEEYATDEYNVASHFQKMSKDYSKFITKQVVISTWQTLSKMNSSLFKADGQCPVAAVFIDETHSIRGVELSKIVEQLTDTYVRHGMTGTLDGAESNEMLSKGLLGPVKKIVDAKRIIDEGRASKLFIRPIVFKYSEEQCKQFYNILDEVHPNKKYSSEVDYLSNLNVRTEMLIKMFQSVKGNKLVLFERVEGYGEELYNIVKKQHKNTFLITGKVDVKEREEIRALIETLDDAIVFASYGTTSTGVNMPKLHHAFLISSSKSKVRLLQSIGRLMRLHESKDGKAFIYDIVDDFKFKNKCNYTLRHFFERMKLYSSEGHSVKITKLNVK